LSKVFKTLKIDFDCGRIKVKLRKSTEFKNLITSKGKPYKYGLLIYNLRSDFLVRTIILKKY